MIRLNNEWVHIDPTFDLPTCTTNVSYEYFCIDDEYAELDRVPDDDVNYPTSIEYDEEGAKAEFDKFMTQIKENYDDKILTTKYITKFKPFGSFLYYTVLHLNDGVYDKNIKMQPWFMYSRNWIQIELREYRY